MTPRLFAIAATAAFVGTLAAPAAATVSHAYTDLTELSIEALANIAVTSVSKRSEPLSGAAAAIYAITNEDIRRSGSTSLPEVLRLAPNLDVARVSGFHYAVSARGFNGFNSSNKLLVLIDGRSVYTPLHSGVFWDAQDVMLEDVDRIEVISGSGGTLWGANAVNGVINIVTRRPGETQGGLVKVGGGTLDRNIAARYGGRLGGNTTYRVYFKGFERGNTVTAAGADLPDDWDRLQGGLAIDWHGERDVVTVQSDIYDSDYDAFSGSEISGSNVLARWSHQFAIGSPLVIQTYYDKTRRIAPPGINETLETYDLSIQHGFVAGDRHNVVWGAGYRKTHDSYVNGSPFILAHEQGKLHIANIFAHDKIALRDHLALTLGMKVEHHTYTGFEYMPNARLAWRMSDSATVWAAVSRAVRTPARTDRELISRTPGLLAAAPNFKSETLVAYEAGYRGRPIRDTTLSVSVFYNTYDDLRTTARSPSGGRPFSFDNGMAGNTYGIEAWGNHSVRDWWRLSAGFTALHKNLHLKPGHTDTSGLAAAGSDPEYQASLRSRMNPVKNVEIDIGLRAIGARANPVVPGYVELDVRLGWHMTDAIELSVSGLNLLHDHHPEIGAAPSRREVRRAIYLSAQSSF